MLIPIVIAHGEYEWRFKKTLSSVVDVPSEEFLVYLPDFQYALFDINVEDIRGYAFHSALKALFSIWKIRFNREVINELKEAMIFLLQDNNLDEKQGDQFLKVLVHYVSMIRPSEEYPEILEMVKLLPAGDATMQTIADMLKEEGKIEGKLEGKIEKCQDMLIKALKLKFDIVKPSLINKIQSIQSVHVLDNLFELAFKASSIEEFTGYLNQLTDA
jgi:hypothetical protein